MKEPTGRTNYGSALSGSLEKTMALRNKYPGIIGNREDSRISTEQSQRHTESMRHGGCSVVAIPKRCGDDVRASGVFTPKYAPVCAASRFPRALLYRTMRRPTVSTGGGGWVCGGVLEQITLSCCETLPLRGWAAAGLGGVKIGAEVVSMGGGSALSPSTSREIVYRYAPSVGGPLHFAARVLKNGFSARCG